MGKRWVTAPTRSGEGFAGGQHQPPGHGACAGDRDLLSDDGAHGELEAVGGAGHASAGVAPHQRADQRIAPQGLPDGHGVGIEVEELSAARHRGLQVAQVREDELALHVGRAVAVLALRRAERHDAVPVGKPQAARVGGTVERLDAGECAQPEEVEHRGGVEGLAAGEAEPDGLRCGLLLVAPAQRRTRGARPQPTRRVGERLADGVVALAHAGEAGGEGHVGDGEIGRLEQDARRLAALRPCQGERTGAHLGGDEAVQLAGAVAETGGQALDALAVDDAVADQAHGPGDDIGPDVPLGRARRGVGSAAQAGAEAGLLRGGRSGVEAHVLALGSAGRAARAAVDPGGGDGAEELAVEAGVLALRRLVAAVRVLDHECQPGMPL